jgi:chloramphenicol O-acetyltransferase type A
MMKTIDLNSWNRKEHFEFFSTFDDPTFGIVTEIDCTRAYAESQKQDFSFFAYYMHNSLLAANKIEELRYRIHESKPVIYDEIHASPTIGREDGTFGFSFVAYNQDFKVFSDSLKQEITNVQNSTGLRKSVDIDRINTIYYSTLPWTSFSGLKHPMDLKFKAGIPKITFGKMFDRDGKKIMPIAIHAHHALVDGLHIANYLEIFQDLLDK